MTQHGAVRAILDAKYRDLWENPRTGRAVDLVTSGVIVV